jgi:hypothetical protein
MAEIPIVDGEEWSASRDIDNYYRNDRLTQPQLMWLDVITAVMQQSTFDTSIGNMGYVFKNMIAKYVSSANFYRVSVGAYETVIAPNTELKSKIDLGEPLDMKKYFYGKDKPTLLEHMVPTSVIAKILIGLGKSPDRAQIAKVLQNSGEVAIILRTEDALLPKSKMPNNWTIDHSYLRRYEDSGVRLLDHVYVRRNHVIYR